MSKLKRNLIVEVDGMELRDPLKITATVTKDVEANTPDFAQITLMNLSEATRTYMTTSKKVAIYAGYGDKINLVFIGDLQAVTNSKQGTEWVTTLICGDGSTAIRQALVNKTYTQPISNKELIKDLVKISGLSELSVEFIDVPNITELGRGTTLEGQATEILDKISTSMNLEWNIQNEAVVVSSKTEARPNQAYSISVETGMVGSPEWVNSGEDLSGKAPKDGYRLKVKSLCIPSIRPNDRIRVISQSISGKIGSFTYKNDPLDRLNDQFKVMTVDHNLDSREGEFTTLIEGRLL